MGATTIFPAGGVSRWPWRKLLHCGFFCIDPARLKANFSLKFRNRPDDEDAAYVFGYNTASRIIIDCGATEDSWLACSKKILGADD